MGCSIITAGKSTCDGRSEGESIPPACLGVGFAVKDKYKPCYYRNRNNKISGLSTLSKVGGYFEK